MGITELQERVEVPAKIGISIKQVARQAMNEDGQKSSKFSGKKKENYLLQLGQMRGGVGRLGRLGKKVSRHKS